MKVLLKPTKSYDNLRKSLRARLKTPDPREERPLEGLYRGGGRGSNGSLSGISISLCGTTRTISTDCMSVSGVSLVAAWWSMLFPGGAGEAGEVGVAVGGVAA